MFETEIKEQIFLDKDLEDRVKKYFKYKSLISNIPECKHRKKLFCCQCRYGERSWQQSRKGMFVEIDVVNFIRFNKNLNKECT